MDPYRSGQLLLEVNLLLMLLLLLLLLLLMLMLMLIVLEGCGAVGAACCEGRCAACEHGG